MPQVVAELPAARPSTGDIMNDMRTRSQVDYLSGKQSWQFGRSFEVKK